MSENGHTIEGTAEEVGTAVAVTDPHPPTPSLFGTDDPVEVIERATRVADALKDVIVRRKLYETIQGKDHVKVEGWQLLGSMLGVTAVCVATEPVDGGWKATVEARTIDGRVIGRADALCTKHEKRGPWKNADEYARLSMSQTRATSKALKGPLGFVISLAGYATTPAEEMTFAQPDQTAAVPAAQRIGKTATKQLNDQLERFTRAGGDWDALCMQAVALGGELDNDPDAGPWHLLTREQGKALYEWMQEATDAA